MFKTIAKRKPKAGKWCQLCNAINRSDPYAAQNGPGFLYDFYGISCQASALRLCGDSQIAGARISFHFGEILGRKFHAFFVWDDFPAVAYMEEVPWHLIAPDQHRDGWYHTGLFD
jgi:hypothetical protein